MSEEETKPVTRMTTKKATTKKASAPKKTAAVESATPRKKAPTATKPATPAPAPSRAPRRRAQQPEESSAPITETERRAMIESAAYYRAQSRGFSPGYEMEDWLAGEKEIETMLAEKKGR